MPASFLSRFLKPLRRQNKVTSRLGHQSSQVCAAEYLEDRRLLSVNVNTVTPELQFDLNQQALPVSFDVGAELDGVIYFYGQPFEQRGDDPTLWKYDPAANDGAGQVLPFELTGDTDDLETVLHITAHDGKLYIRTYDRDLFTIDPNTSVVTKIATLNSSVSWDRITYDEMIVHDGSLYYRNDGSSGSMYLSRYTPGIGTTEVASFQVGAGETAHEMLLVNDKVYLNVIGANGNFQVWEYDPAIEGAQATRLVVETSFGVNEAPEMIAANGKIYFTAEDNRSLWEVDPQGDPNPTGVELFHTSELEGYPTNDILDLVALKGKLYWTSSQRGSISFWEFDPESGEDPRNIGFDLLHQESPSVINLWAGEDHLYLFSSLYNVHEVGGGIYGFPGEAILKYDPSQQLSDSTTIITDVDLGSVYWYSERTRVFEVGTSIFFPGKSDDFRDDTLLRYEMAANEEPGTLSEVRQSVALNESSNPHELTVIGDSLYFTASDGIHGYELWKATIQDDGRLTSPEMIADLYTGILGSKPENLVVIDGVLYFDALNQGVASLWRYDPASDTLTWIDATGPFTDVVTVGSRRYYFWFGSHQLYLQQYDADTPLGNGELIEVPDFHIERIKGLPHYTTVIGETIYFTIENAVTGAVAIYVYDTVANEGAGPLKRIELPDGVTSPKHFTDFNGKIYFQAVTESFRRELFEYDPSDDSIRQLTDFNSVRSYGFPSRLTVFNDKLYFRAQDDSSPYQLWSFDPTANDGSGQVQLAFELEEYSWLSGSYHDEESPFLIHDGRMYLDAIRSVGSGFDILVVEPSVEGHLLSFAESIENPSSSFTDYEYVVAGNHLFSNMFGEIGGRELYSIPLISGEVNAEFRYAQDAGDVAGIVENTPSQSTPTFDEWDSPIGQIWLTIGPHTAAQAFDLTVDLEWNTLWSLGPEITSHLGSEATVVNQNNSGTRTSSVTIDDMDLSSYEVGDRVLVGTLRFSLNPDNSSNVPVDTAPDSPPPVPQPGAALVGAKNETSRQPILFDDAQGSLQFTPVQYDVNDDDQVSIADFAQFIRNYGKTADASSPEAYRFDFNQDGRVGIADFALFISHYGQRKFPLGEQTSQPATINSEPSSRALSPSSKGALEGEPVLSTYWATAVEPESVSAVDQSFHEEEQDYVEFETKQLTVTDLSWDARVVDAAIRGSELFLATSEQVEQELDEVVSAEF